MKNGNYIDRNRKNQNMKLIKNFKTEEGLEEDYAKNKNKNLDKGNNINIEFTLRNLLFKKNNPVKRNKSVEKRKRVVRFNLEK